MSETEYPPPAPPKPAQFKIQIQELENPTRKSKYSWKVWELSDKLHQDGDERPYTDPETARIKDNYDLGTDKYVPATIFGDDPQYHGTASTLYGAELIARRYIAFLQAKDSQTQRRRQERITILVG